MRTIAFVFGVRYFLSKSRRDLVVVFLFCFKDDRCSPCQLDHGRIGYPEGGRDDDLVALLEKCLEKVVEAVFSAAGNDDLFTLIGQPVITIEFVDDCILERIDAGNRGIPREIIIDGLDRRLLLYGQEY